MITTTITIMRTHSQTREVSFVWTTAVCEAAAVQTIDPTIARARKTADSAETIRFLFFFVGLVVFIDTKVSQNPHFVYVYRQFPDRF